MAIVWNVTNERLALTRGYIDPDEQRNVDVTQPAEAAHVSNGALVVVDPTATPPAPTTKTVPVVTTVAFTDPARQVTLDIAGEATDAELAAAIAAIGGRFRGAYASLTNGTLVKANDVVTNPSGALVSRIADGTISGSYNSANWTALSAGSSSAGVVGKGYRIPQGALDGWKAARAASAATRAEVLGFGDSLLWGQGPAGGAYSFFQRLRERAVAAGFTDGGRGLNAQYNQTTDNYSGEVAPVSAQTGFAAGSSGGLYFMPGSLFSSTPNDSVTFKVVGTKARLWFSRYVTASRFTYQVNGGAVITVNAGGTELPPIPASATLGSSSIDMLMLTSADGMTNGTNTIVVTNLGYGPLANSALAASGAFGSGGTITPGTYYYAYTIGPTGGGETTPTVIGSVSIGSGQKFYIQYPAVGVGKTVRLYRGTTATPSAMGLVASGTTSGSGIEIDDTGGTAPGVAPPTTNTAQDPAQNFVAVAIEALKDTGIVFQNHGIQGSETSDVFGTQDLTNNPMALAALGLQWGTSSNGLGVGLSSELLPPASASGADAPLVRATARKPALVIIAYGNNDFGKGEGGFAALAAPSGVDGGAGVGSGLAAATYYYKVQRVAEAQFGGGPLSPASSGVAVTSGHQAIVTPPVLGGGNYVGVPVFNVFRATSSGGTYGFVGQIIGSSGQFIDNVATPGAAPSGTTVFTPIVDTSATENALALAIRLARNAGADVLVVLPSIESNGNSRSLGGVFKAAIQGVAEAFSCAWVDWDVALGPNPLRAGLGYGGGSNNPHLLKPAYQAQGDFLWDNVLSK